MEEPRPRPQLLRELRALDPRLAVRISPIFGVWEVVEALRSGTWSHCFFWAEGSYPNYWWRPLPDTAEPLVRKLAQLDCMKYGQRKGAAKVREMELSGRRADIISMARREKNAMDRRSLVKQLMREKLAGPVREYRRVAARFGKKWGRAGRAGGRAAAEALYERAKAIEDVGL